MIAETVDYPEAIERLPRSGTLVLYSVPWEEYTEVLTQTENNPAYRVSYKDPPPDVVVEVDTTNESIEKFEIYAALNVPEIWRFDGESFQILLLDGDRYRETADSLALPLINAQILTEYLNRGKTEGQTAMLKTFRRYLRNEL